jgi:hypothetical protein
MSGESEKRRVVVDFPRDLKFLIGIVVGVIVAPLIAVALALLFGLG